MFIHACWLWIQHVCNFVYTLVGCGYKSVCNLYTCLLVVDARVYVFFYACLLAEFARVYVLTVHAIWFCVQESMLFSPHTCWLCMEEWMQVVNGKVLFSVSGRIQFFMPPPWTWCQGECSVQIVDLCICRPVRQCWDFCKRVSLQAVTPKPYGICSQNFKRGLTLSGQWE